jgi:hypothetical protein
MFLTITGGTKTQRMAVESIAQHSGAKLMSSRLYPKLEIDIQLTSKLFKEDGVIGDVIWEDRNHKPRWFTMRVDTGVSKRRMLETIAHEMVHIAQFATGRLVELDRTRYHRWEGKIYKKQLNYWDRPWEIEAHGRECGLFLQWVEENNLQNQAWTWDDLDKYKQAYE